VTLRLRWQHNPAKAGGGAFKGMKKAMAKVRHRVVDTLHIRRESDTTEDDEESEEEPEDKRDPEEVMKEKEEKLKVRRERVAWCGVEGPLQGRMCSAERRPWVFRGVAVACGKGVG
jgi:hypothetical protein